MSTTQKVVHIDPVGEITIIRNKRSRKLRMTVRPDKKVFISMPYHSSFSDALKFASNNTEWIIKQQKKIETVSTNYTIGSKIITKFHTLFILNGSGNPVAEKRGTQVGVFVPADNDLHSQDFIREVLTRIYRTEAIKYLPVRLRELAGHHGFGFNRVTIRNNRRNWGSCSSKNNISLNLQIMKLPDELIDYILLHELVHTKEKNHGPGFWSLLGSITGNRARELAKNVKKYSPYL